MAFIQMLCVIRKQILIKIIPLAILICFIFSCKSEEVDGIIIGADLYVHQTYSENKKMQNLIKRAVLNDKEALIELKNFPNGGGGGSYDLGYVLTQIIYRIGEDKFAKTLKEIPQSERRSFKGLIGVGLEYGDNDYDNEMDYKEIEKEFPKLALILNE